MRLWLLDVQRRRWRRHAEAGPMSVLLDTGLPRARTAFRDLELVCLDLETTGLDSEAAEILSAGWILIRGNRVDMSTAAGTLVRPRGGVGASAAVHGITDSRGAEGLPVEEVMARIVEVLAGRCLVVHHAALDKALLDRESRRCFGAPLAVPVIDTLALERRRRQRAHHLGDGESLRLADVREHYGLPWYSGHDALADALATAELLLAMVARHGDSDRTTLADLIR